MNLKKFIALCLMIVGVLFCLFYCIFGASHQDMYGLGVWLISLAIFAVGAGTFFEGDIS